jgi:hypothetical protein
MHDFTKLGFHKYRDYLDSQLWRDIRESILTRDNHQCQCCQGPATCVHHISYDLEVMKGHQPESLCSLCEACHHYVEHTDDGHKIKNLTAKAERLDCLRLNPTLAQHPEAKKLVRKRNARRQQIRNKNLSKKKIRRSSKSARLAAANIKKEQRKQRDSEWADKCKPAHDKLAAYRAEKKREEELWKSSIYNRK